MKDTLTKAEVEAIVVEIIGFIPKGYKVSRPRGFNAWMLSNGVGAVDLGNSEKSVRDELTEFKDAFTK